MSMASVVISVWDRRNTCTHTRLSSRAAHYGFDLDTPLQDLSEQVRQKVLHGSGDEEIGFLYVTEKGRPVTRKHPFEGIIPNLERRWHETRSEERRVGKACDSECRYRCSPTRAKKQIQVRR